MRLLAETILVVEDEGLLRTLMTNMLSEVSPRVIAVHSAEAALGVLKAQEVDLALLDISLPGKSGVELLENICNDFPSTAVVMVTGVNELSTALYTLRVGAYDYVTKPFKQEELCLCASRALERRRLTIENTAYQQSLEQLVSDRTRELEQALDELQKTYDQTIHALGAALDLRDSETEDHCARVAGFAVRLARELGLDDPDTLRYLKWGAYLHDIGKIGIPDAILMKPDSLSTEEYKAIQSHPLLGSKMLEGIPFLNEAAIVVYYHHEQYDGSGYPDGISGEDIPKLARIFSVADTVDAMTSPRPYRDALTWDDVRKELVEKSGLQFDPQVVLAFLAVPDDDWMAVILSSSPSSDINPAAIANAS